MADRYVYNGGDGTNSSAGWTHAYQTLAAAITASAAGDPIFYAHDHSEAVNTTGAVSLTFKGTAASPTLVMSINRAAGNFPPLAADYLKALNPVGADGFTCSLGGIFLSVGLRYQGGATTAAGNVVLASASFSYQKFKYCDFIVGTGVLSTSGSNTASAECEDCTIIKGSTSNSNGYLSPGANIKWSNRIGVAAFSVPATPGNYIIGTNTTGIAELTGLDFTPFSSSNLTQSGSNPILRFINCKIPTSLNINPPSSAGGRFDLLQCGDGTGTPRNETHQYQGTMTTETTIVRTGGASDGTTAFSWKCVTNANNELQSPFETLEGEFWNDTSGSSKTLTVHIVTDNVTLNDNDIWVEARFPGDASTMLSDRTDDGPATMLSTGTAQTSDSGTAWTTTGLTTPVKQKLEVTFTPLQKGLIRWKVKIAKVSTTVYVDPNPDFA